MVIVTPETFLKQSDKMQFKLRKLWKCDEGELYITIEAYEADSYYSSVLCTNIDLESQLNGEWDYFKTTAIPLFTEGQLREMIEEHTKCFLELCFIDYMPELICSFDFHSKFTGNSINLIETKSEVAKNMTELYWKILLRVLDNEFYLED